MPIQIANNYQAALTLLQTKANATFEVTKDGGIREQTSLEKFKLFASKLVRSYTGKKEAKDAAVADALQGLYQKTGSISDGPLQNDVTVRFFSAKQRVELKGGTRAENTKVDQKSLDQFKSPSAKSSKSSESSSLRDAEVQQAAKVAPKKTIADYASLAPRAIIDYDHSENGIPSKLKGVKTEWELGDILGSDPELGNLRRIIEDKSTSNPSALTPEEFRWLRPADKLENRDLRFKAYTPARIQKAHIIFNDRLKIALYELSKSHPNPKKLNIIVKENIEGIAGSYTGGSVDIEHLNKHGYKIDFNRVQLALSEIGLIIGEGPLAEFDGADFDVVKWSEKVGEAPIPKGAPSPLAWQDLSHEKLKNRELSTIPFDQRDNTVRLGGEFKPD